MSLPSGAFGVLVVAVFLLVQASGSVVPQPGTPRGLRGLGAASHSEFNAEGVPRRLLANYSLGIETDVTVMEHNTTTRAPATPTTTNGSMPEPPAVPDGPCYSACLQVCTLNPPAHPARCTDTCAMFCSEASNRSIIVETVVPTVAPNATAHDAPGTPTNVSAPAVEASPCMSVCLALCDSHDASGAQHCRASCDELCAAGQSSDYALEVHRPVLASSTTSAPAQTTTTVGAVTSTTTAVWRTSAAATTAPATSTAAAKSTTPAPARATTPATGAAPGASAC